MLYTMLWQSILFYFFQASLISEITSQRLFWEKIFIIVSSIEVSQTIKIQIFIKDNEN